MRYLNLKSVDIVKAITVSKGSVSQWIHGISAPSGKNVIPLSRVLQCSPDWLLTGKEKKAVEEEVEWYGDLQPWDQSIARNDDEVVLPFFLEVERSAGNGGYLVQKKPDLKLRFAKRILKQHGIDPAYAACIKMTGNSMEPVLPHGATVGVNMTETAVVDGKIFALDQDGMLRVKVLYRVPRGIRLRSFNYTECPDEIYTDKQAKQIRILGRVFWYSALI